MSCHRHCIPLSVLLCCLALSHDVLYGGVANSIRTATPVNQGAKNAIERDISKQVTTLVDGIKQNNQTDVMQARRTLIDNGDTNTSPGTASAAYQAEYASQLEGALSKLIAPTNPRLVRLNAAIILGEVAEKVSRTDSADIFANVAALLLQSKEFEGQLWGLKIAKYAVASDADKTGKLGNASLNLSKLIVKAVENSKYPGELIEEAYQTLKLEPLAGPQGPLQNNRKLAQGLAVQTLPDILDLVEWRTQQYKSGPVPNPRAESELTGYLPVGGALDAVLSAPELRDRTLKAIGELTCAQLKAASDILAAGNPADPDLVEVTHNCGSAMASFGTALTNSNPPVNGAEALGAAGDTISKTISLTTPDDKLKSWCDALAKALQGMNIAVSMP